MSIRQISVFLENRKGRLADFSSVLAGRGIDMLALSVADTANFGILRAIAADCEAAVEALRQDGFSVNLTDVLAVAVPDRPGSLAKVLRPLDDEGVSVEYIYSLVRRLGQDAVIIIQTSNNENALRLLQEKGVRLLSEEDLTS
jgi:hypothetical protein